MKKSLSTFLAVVLLAVVADAAPYFPGAWYCTKAPSPGTKFAGAIEVFFYNDHKFAVDLFSGGAFDQTFEGAYTENAKFFFFTGVDAEGWVWTGKLNKVTLQLTGTFKSAAFAGKFQGTKSDDGQ